MKQPLLNNHIKRNSKKKDKAYFASKSELLAWVNTTLDLEITGIEQTITGAIFCQLLDAAHPGTIRMNKVNWKAKLETEYIANFKIFQQGLSTNNIDKPINIDRLSKGKAQELIELLQWLYGHHISLKINPANYDAKKKRNGQTFIFFGDKKRNNINNKNIRDDLSQCSSNTDFRDNQMKNNLKNRININNLNANLRRDNFHTKFNYQNQQQDISSLNNIKNKRNQGKSDKNSIYNNSSNHSNISVSSNSEKNEDNSYKNKNVNSIMSSPFIIKEQPEENLKENEDEKLNNILFDGINNVDKENILELEKKDKNNIHDLKMLVRKLRVNNIIFKNNFGNILNKVTRERDFYLNKLKDIEYLYFNSIIRNTNENKIILLKNILTSNTDSTITINGEGIASINGNESYTFLSDEYNNNKEETNKKEDIIEEKTNNLNAFTDKEGNNHNIGKNSQKQLPIKIIFSKDNNKISNEQIIVDGKNIINKTQPNNGLEPNKSEKNINDVFSINNILKSNKVKKIKKENKIQIIPSNKTFNINISSHILNESLNIPNSENNNPNTNNAI